MNTQSLAPHPPQRRGRWGNVNTLLLFLITFGAIAAASTVDSKSSSCDLLELPPAYTFIGGGFHMHLAIEYPIALAKTTITLNLPKSFFIDEAEAEQLYRMEVISFGELAGTQANVEADVTQAYTPLHMRSQFFFDIEAPVFKVSYTTNHVELTFQRHDGKREESSVLDSYMEGGDRHGHRTFGARLIIPIHSRYEELDATTHFSLSHFLFGEDAYVRRCLSSVEVAGRADARCSSERYIKSATEAMLSQKSNYAVCLNLPVGVLDDLPRVYHALMGLLVAGAILVIISMR